MLQETLSPKQTNNKKPSTDHIYPINYSSQHNNWTPYFNPRTHITNILCELFDYLVCEHSMDPKHMQSAKQLATFTPLRHQNPGSHHRRHKPSAGWCTGHWSKWTGGLHRCHILEKSNRALQRHSPWGKSKCSFTARTELLPTEDPISGWALASWQKEEKGGGGGGRRRWWW